MDGPLIPTLELVSGGRISHVPTPFDTRGEVGLSGPNITNVSFWENRLM